MFKLSNHTIETHSLKKLTRFIVSLVNKYIYKLKCVRYDINKIAYTTIGTVYFIILSHIDYSHYK